MAFWALIAGAAAGLLTIAGARFISEAQVERSRKLTTVEPTHERSFTIIGAVLLAVALICAFAAGGM